MRVEIEVPVITWGRAKSTHSNKTVFASVPRVFEIPEYSRSEVPVVVAFSERHPDDHTRRVEYFGVDGHLYTDRHATVDDGSANAFRFFRHNNSFLHPFFAEFSREMTSCVDRIRRESVALAKTKMIPMELNEQFGNVQTVPFRFETLSALGIRDFGEQEVENCIERFSKRMSRAIVVGNTVMFREQDPVIEISSNVGVYHPDVKWRARTRPETAPLLDMKGRSDRPIEFIGLKDHELLRERVETIARRFGVKELSKISGNEIFDVEINDRGYLNTSAEGVSLMAAATLMRDFYVDKVMTFSRYDDDVKRRQKAEDMLVELDLADVGFAQQLLFALREEDEAVAADMLEPVVSDIVAKTRSGLGGSAFGGQAIIEHAGDALERWHDREVGLSLAIAPALRA